MSAYKMWFNFFASHSAQEMLNMIARSQFILHI